jgi:hypothetical protein
MSLTYGLQRKLEKEADMESETKRPIDTSCLPLLQEINHFLCWVMINHPDYEAREVAMLNHKICRKIKDIKEKQ